MRARAAGFAEGAGSQASSRRERIGGSVMGRILGPFGIEARVKLASSATATKYSSW